jgi:hypothetical protein
MEIKLTYSKADLCNVWSLYDPGTLESELFPWEMDFIEVLSTIKSRGFVVYHRRGCWYAYKPDRESLQWRMNRETSNGASYEELAVTLLKTYPKLDPARAERAIALCNAPTTAGPNIIQSSDTSYRVRSQHTPHQWYTVNTLTHSCTCPDSQRGNTCKHRIAVQLFRQRAAIAPDPAPAAAPAARPTSAELLKSLGYD